MRFLPTVLFTFLALGFSTWCTVRVVANIQFNRECGGHLSRAANANTITIAKKELATALAYMEREKLTEGYTSVVYQTPDEDIGYWYSNIKASFDELNQLSPDSSQLEKTNVLMKLRETLTDQGESGTKLVVPSGISIYPFNGIMLIFGWFCALGLMLVVFLIDLFD